jgi:hypothetical protein
LEGAQFSQIGLALVAEAAFLEGKVVEVAAVGDKDVAHEESFAVGGIGFVRDCIGEFAAADGVQAGFHGRDAEEAPFGVGNVLDERAFGVSGGSEVGEDAVEVLLVGGGGVSCSRISSSRRPKDLIKRAAILDAARDMFFSLGLGGVTIEGVAKASRVSRMTVYGHFGDKETLFTEVIKREAHALGTALSGMSSDWVRTQRRDTWPGCFRPGRSFKEHAQDGHAEATRNREFPH